MMLRLLETLMDHLSFLVVRTFLFKKIFSFFANVQEVVIYTLIVIAIRLFLMGKLVKLRYFINFSLMFWR